MTDIVKTQTLEERITARLHDSIGDLITDADLKAIVERGIEKALFEPRSNTDYYGRKSGEPSIVDRLVQSLLTERMTKAVDQWIKDNPEKITEAIEKCMKAGVASALLDTLDWKFENIFKSGVMNMQNQGLIPRG